MSKKDTKVENPAPPAAELAAQTQVFNFPLPIGEWIPGYEGSVALKHKHGSWSISHSNQVDPASQWSGNGKTKSGPEMLREQGYVAWIALDVDATTEMTLGVKEGGEAASPASATALVHVGTLCVFDDKEATFGFGYDISTNRKGHHLLQTLDGAKLYAVKPPAVAG